LGSSRRRQLREGPGEAPVLAPSPGEDSLWASQVVQRVQDLLGEQDKDRTGFVTRSDVQKLQEEGLPCSTEELQLLFDGLDAAGSGRISIEEFTAGLRQFLSSHKAARHQHRRRKTASQRVHLVLPSPELEGVDSEEQKHFAAFLDQLGMDNTSEEQQLWQLWVKLRQEEPQLRDKPEDFLAEMRLRIQGAKSKEALEVTLNKRVAEHDLEVQQFCQTLEQQLKEEGQRLEQESGARRQQHRTELQQALDAGEREVLRLITAQRELEARCHRLCSTQQAANTENQQLEESNQVLEEQLQHLHQQLQQTHRHLQATRAT
ncbi:RAB44 protein, partial [Ramphastos sulfuratus]|nr:RAB44 protein [Ramphastos sulfuratus]